MDVDEQVMLTLESALNVKLDRSRFGSRAPLLGAVPEFDSMAVVALLTALEERFGFTINDDEVDGSTFATIGSLTSFVRAKLAA